MSNETKDKTAAEAVAENPAAVAETTASNAGTVEVATQATAPGKASAKKSGKGKKPSVAENVANVTSAVSELTQAAKGAGNAVKAVNASALHAVGKAACKRHGLPAVWVTADGQCFAQENDARHHGKSLGLSAEPLKVEA